jgi:hypothetical protein
MNDRHRFILTVDRAGIHPETEGSPALTPMLPSPGMDSEAERGYPIPGEGPLPGHFPGFAPNDVSGNVEGGRCLACRWASRPASDKTVVIGWDSLTSSPASGRRLGGAGVVTQGLRIA